MAAKLPVWGIDIGQCALKAVRVQPAGDQIELLDAIVIEHPQILSQPDADAAALIRASLEKLLAKHDVRREPVAVAVPGQQTLTRFTKLPPVEPKKVPDIVNFEARQQIPFDMDEVVWDYEILSPKDSPDVEVGIFAIRKELIRGHLTYFTSQGIEPVVVQSAPLASYNALRFDGQLGEETTLLLDIGAVSTDLIVVEGNSIWSRPVPIGGNNFTEALVNAFKLSFPKAEALKRTAATSKYARQIFQAMRPVFADLVSEVQRSIGFYTSTHRQSEIVRVLGMGNAFGLPGLQKFLQQNLQLRADKFAGLQRLAPSPAAKSPAFNENVLSFAVSFGLAIQGLGLAQIGSSLLPADVARQQMWRKKRPLFAASAACMALAAGTVWLGNFLAQSRFEARAGEIRSATLVPAPSVERAEQLLASPPSPASMPPLQVAATLGGAFEKLAAEYRALPSLADQERKIQTISQLPAASVLVPQIFDVIDRVFHEAMPEAVRNVTSSEEYLALTRRMSRAERSEIWIEQIISRYDRQDAARAFATTARDVSAQEEGPRAGWGIVIYGRTTRPDPAGWLGQIVARLEREGRQPDRLFWFANVELRNLQEGESAAPGAGPSRGARTDGLPAVGSRSGRLPPGRGDSRTSGRTPPRGTTATRTLAELLRDLEPRRGVDPVTGESTLSDWSFVISLSAIKGKPPPEVLQKSGDKPPPAAGDDAQQPAQQPARGDERD